MGRLRKDFKKRLLSNLGSRSQAAGESVSLKQSSRHSRTLGAAARSWARFCVAALQGQPGSHQGPGGQRLARESPGGGGHFKLHSMRTLDCQGAGGPSVHGREVGRDLERTRAHVSDK